MDDKFLKPYDPKATEERIYKLWEDSGFFNPDVCVEKEVTEKNAEPFTILMPPTNANGSLHAGHGLVMTIEDLIIRYKRMRGFKTLWLPGLDHAGFETQVVYEKKLEKEGRTRFGMERNKLYAEILDFTLENSKNIKNQVRKMGASCDWSREKFTLDESIIKIVYETFKKLSDDKLLYRGKRIISWCPKHQTSFADIEIKDEERIEPYYYLKYGPFIISTSRPETKFGDKYVVMHPKDKRYAKYKHGQKIDLEWINGPITASIIKDEATDMEFGTGVMTITPWHDPADFEIAERHNLEKEQIIDEKGKLLPIAGEFAGMHIKKARPLIIEKLKGKGLLEKIDENYKHVVHTCYKCGTIIEPQVQNQWFIKTKPLAEKALEKIKKGEIKYIPEHYKKITTHWLENIIDWNISRQIVWGIPIPVWYCGENAKTMKRIGFAGDIVTQVFDAKTRTYRLRNHEFQIDDKVAFEDSLNKKIFGYGKITEIKITTVGEIDLQDKKHWKTYKKREELIAAFKRHHPEKDIKNNTKVWIYTYKFDKNIPKENCGSIIITDGKKPEKCPVCDGKNLIHESDTFDTWFSSGQWPFVVFDYPDGKDFKTFYPTNVLETAGDIFHWVARMIMLGLYVTDKLPFDTVYMHGLILDAKGQKMSKSKHNVIDPLLMTEKFGTDAFRMGVIVGNTPGTSLALSEDKIKAYKHFANKLWNISRFVLEQIGSQTYADLTQTNAEKLTEANQELLNELNTLIKDITNDMENYRFYLASEKIYHYVWHKFADEILEESKEIIKQGGKKAEERKIILISIWKDCLKILHPFMPFITEEIWQTMKKERLLMVEKWPC